MRTLLFISIVCLSSATASSQVSIGGMMGVDTSYRLNKGTRPVENDDDIKERQYKILDVTDDGCRVWDDFYENDYFIYGITGYSDRYYKSNIRKVGSYTYRTVQGATRKIPAYKVVSPQEMSELAAVALEKSRKEREEKAKQNEHDKEINRWYNMAIKENAKQAKQATSLKVFEFRKEQATNGLPTSQYMVGKAYLEGDNCQTNKALGIYWLTKSSEQGNVEAKELLKETLHSN